MQSFDLLSIPSKIAITLLVLLMFLVAPDSVVQLGNILLALFFVVCVWNWDRIPK